MSATPRPGRPEVGPNINVRIPQDLLDWVDERAEAEGQTRAEVIRDYLSSARSMSDWTERTQQRWKDEAEAGVQEALTVSPTHPTGYWHAGRVPEGADPNEWLQRVLTVWGERHAPPARASAFPHEPHLARYARGVAKQRLGYEHSTPGGRHLDNDERREVRKQIDEILAEVREQASNG
jgi:hypothetical protein